jgi:hypothetical protein
MSARNGHAAAARRLELLLHRLQIEPEDHEVDRLLRSPDRFEERLDAVGRLDDELHSNLIPA